MAQQTIDIGSAPNDGTGDPIRDAFDKCNDNFTELYTGLTGLLDFKGSTDASANPNYPAASKGDFYVISVAGKIGGASGIDVEVGDAYFAKADNAGGNQATVGTSWTVIQGNITGGVAGAIEVLDEGVSETATLVSLDFVGAGVTASDDGSGNVTVTIPGGGGGSGVDVEDEGVSEATGVTVLNFTGAGVTASDAGGGQVEIDIPGGSGSIYSPPLVSDFPTTVNCGAETTFHDTVDGFLIKVGVGGSGAQLRCKMKAYPATPFSIIFLPKIMASLATSTGDGSGLMIRDSSGGKVLKFGLEHTSLTGQVILQHWTNVSTFSATIGTASFNDPYLKFEDDGTNHKFYVGLSQDGPWYQWQSQSRTVWLPAMDQIGFGVEDHNFTDYFLLIRHYEQA